MPGGSERASTLWHFAFCKEMGEALRPEGLGQGTVCGLAEVSLDPREGKEASGFLEDSD